MHVKTTSSNAITIKITADELAEVMARHCADHMGFTIPESRKCMLSLTADGQPVRRLKLMMKW